MRENRRGEERGGLQGWGGEKKGRGGEKGKDRIPFTKIRDPPLQSIGPLYSNTVISTWPLMGGLLNLVRRGWAWAGCGFVSPLLAVPNVTFRRNCNYNKHSKNAKAFCLRLLRRYFFLEHPVDKIKHWAHI